jgi:hypothetical protein
MDLFYIVVLTIAVVFLILILTYVGLAMKSKTSNMTVYPGARPVCPDYWNLAADGSSCLIPTVGAKNIGTIYNANGASSLVGKTSFGLSSDGKSINFSDPGWGNSGANPICAQQKWTLNNNIVWDGVTNYNNC